MMKVWRHTKKVIIAIIGVVVLVVGIIAIPYPGPGWLIVFAGLGILSTEFEWAQRLLDYGRERFESWNKWVLRQHWAIRLVITLFTLAIVIVTIWLLNGYGILNSWLHLKLDWLQSPLPWFK
jgi:uncharacterized protein (TIGR02611 family)